MNTTPTLISPARAVEPNAAKAAEAGTPDTPFSQVLSNEVANQRSARTSRAETEKAPPQDAAARAETTADVSAADPAVPPAAEAAAPVETPATEVTAETPVPDAATLLGLALAPAPVQATGPQGTAAADAGIETEAPDALAQTFDPAQRKDRPAPGRPLLATEAGAPAGQKTDAAGAGKPVLPAAPLAAADAALQATAAPKDSASPVADGGFEQILHPALRAAAQALHFTNPGQPVADAAQARLAPAVGSAAWGQALGDRIVWMAGNAQQTATLTLNPPNLGPLQVVLNLSNDQAVASFFAAQPEVRQAIEASFPRLREMMGEAGIQLEQATVSADSSPQQQDQAAGRPGQGNAPRFAAGDDATAAVSPVATPVRAGRGLIDTFA